MTKGCVDGVVLDESYKQVVGGERASFRIGEFGGYGGEGGGTGEGGVPCCQVVEKS